MPKSISPVSISYISENAVLLEWPEKICSVQHQHIMYCQKHITSVLKDKIIDSIGSYASLIIYYKFDQIAHKTLENLIQNIVQAPNLPPQYNSNINDLNKNLVEIPVYYGEDSGWDLNNVVKKTGLTTSEIIQTHTQTIYRAYALGFVPGFCYLGELPAQLQLPRKSSPRLIVPKGAVAIAEQQTAVYPNTSPSGWHIIGQTPYDMYSINGENFISTISVGQSVRFISISKTEFLSLGGKLIREQF